MANKEVPNFSMAMGCGQMKGCVISHVCGVYSCPTIHQHLHNRRSTFLGRPMQRTEAMVISVAKTMAEMSELTRKENSPKHTLGLGHGWYHLTTLGPRIRCLHGTNGICPPLSTDWVVPVGPNLRDPNNHSNERRRFTSELGTSRADINLKGVPNQSGRQRESLSLAFISWLHQRMRLNGFFTINSLPYHFAHLFNVAKKLLPTHNIFKQPSERKRERKR